MHAAHSPSSPPSKQNQLRLVGFSEKTNTKMGRIQTDQINSVGPAQPPSTVPMQPYPPPQTHPPPPHQYNYQQPQPPILPIYPMPQQPPPPSPVINMPFSNPPQSQAMYYQGNAAQYNQIPPQTQYGASGTSMQAIGAAPLQTTPGGGTMQQQQFHQQTSTYPGSSGFQMPNLCPSRGNRGFIGTNPWNTGLFDCMQDPSNAFITALFPCITFGQIADILENGNTTCVTSGVLYAFSPCLLSRPYRTKLRKKFGLVEAPAADWMVHTMFEPCALCQEYRELKSHGIDPDLGYHANKEKLQNLQADNNPQVMMAPPQNQKMG
ncbi:hypothetical protein SAY86_017630 [Trapa natans]|uniref:Uncharacterized protein n=1 Tax=Trapa natans TaxID=22666 RepID=A0AAN7M5G3_TRANT|nr:hypothetical protein SAY86_017630 [Trapa natans]